MQNFIKKVLNTKIRVTDPRDLISVESHTNLNQILSFPVMFHKGRPTGKHCFLATFPESGQAMQERSFGVHVF